MRVRLARICNAFNNKTTLCKKFVVIVVVILVYCFLDVVQYIIKKISKDERYFKYTYRERRLDQHLIWDDRILSPREAAVTEEIPPEVVFI